MASKVGVPSAQLHKFHGGRADNLNQESEEPARQVITIRSGSKGILVIMGWEGTLGIDYYMVFIVIILWSILIPTH